MSSLTVIILASFYLFGIEAGKYGLEPTVLLANFSFFSIGYITFTFWLLNLVFLVWSGLESMSSINTPDLPWYARGVFRFFVAPVSGLSSLFLLVRVYVMEATFGDTSPLSPLVRIRRHWSFDERVEYAEAYLNKVGFDVVRLKNEIMMVQPDFFAKLVSDSAGDSIQDVTFTCNAYIIELARVQQAAMEAQRLAASSGLTFSAKLSLLSDRIAKDLVHGGAVVAQYVSDHPYLTIAFTLTLGGVAVYYFGSYSRLSADVAQQSDHLDVVVDVLSRTQTDVIGIGNGLSAVTTNNGTAISALSGFIGDQMIPSIQILEQQNAALLITVNRLSAAVARFQPIVELLEVHPEVIQSLNRLTQPQHMAALAALARRNSSSDA